MCLAPPQAILTDTSTTSSPHTCRLPPGSGSCTAVDALPGSLVQYALGAPREATSSDTPSTRHGIISIFTATSGDVIVTATTTCNCFISTLLPTSNAIHLGPNYSPTDHTAQATSCPASLQAFNYQTAIGSGEASAMQLASCHSWVIPAAQVQAVAASSYEPHTIALTLHFELSC
jgi:hypothetical protein